MKKLFVLLTALTAVFACKKESGTSSVQITCTTGDASELTQESALLSGNCTIQNAEASSGNAYIYYSKTESQAEKLKASGNCLLAGSVAKDGGKFSATASGLEKATTYYYMASASIDGTETSGEVKSFTTERFTAGVTTLDATEIGKATATLNGSLSVNSTENLSKNVWFLYSTTATTLNALWGSGTKMEVTLQADGSFHCNLSSISRGTYYYVAVAKVEDKEVYGDVKSFTTQSPNCPTGAVDLGLSVCWGSRNVGAAKIEDYGDYYAWGETEPKEDYSWGTYKFGASTTGPFSKYNTQASHGNVDNKTVLEPEDDIAHLKLGGSWRMPTSAELDELKNNCTWEWTAVNGVNGYKVTSKQTGYTNKWIFLPAAGYRSEDKVVDAGKNGDYWTSSLDTSFPDLASLLFFENSYIEHDSFSKRYFGHPARAVSE